MPRFEQITAHEQRHRLQEDLGYPEQWIIPVTTRVHEVCDREGWECPCCGAPRGRLLGVEEEFTVLIDRPRGGEISRVRSDQIMTTDGRELFDEIVEAAQTPARGVITGRIPVEFSVFDYAVDDYRDLETPVIYRCGYWQTGKTYQNIAWWGRSLLHGGGPSKYFWVLAPNLDQSFEVYKKVFWGSSGNPPVMPRSLMVREPGKKTDRELWAEAIDGTIIEIRHSIGTGRGLEGKKVERILYDEPTSATQSTPFEIARARTLLTQGQVGMSGVPKDDCEYVYDMIVEPYESGKIKNDGTEETMGGFPKYHETTRVFYMDPRKNPYVPNGALERIVGSDPDEETLLRLSGHWPKHGNKAYLDVWKPAQFQIDEEGFKPEDWGYRFDITEQVTRTIFKKAYPFIGGQDANYDPFTTAIAKLFAHDRQDPTTWGIVWVDEQISKARDARVAAKELARRGGGRYEGKLGLVCDSHMFHKANAHGGQGDQRTADALRFKELGFGVAPPIQGKATSKSTGMSDPGIGDSRTVVRRLMVNGHFHVNAGNCVRLGEMLLRAPFGRKKPTDAGSWLDRNVYNLEDSIRYVVWRVFSKRVEKLSKPGRVVM